MYSQSQDDLGVVSFVEAMEPPRVREFEIGSGPEEAASFSEFVLDYIVPHSVLIDDAESPEFAEGLKLFDKQNDARMVHVRREWPEKLVSVCEQVLGASRIGEMSRRDGESRLAGALAVMRE